MFKSLEGVGGWGDLQQVADAVPAPASQTARSTAGSAGSRSGKGDLQPSCAAAAALRAGAFRSLELLQMSDVIRSRRKALGMATWRTASGFLDQEDPAVLKLRFLSPRLLRSFEA